jgi:AAA family ATP:ADP antiporter
VRAAAVTCLLNHGSGEERKAAADSLMEMLHDADPVVRAEGVKAMGAVRGGRFETSLVGALDDPDPAVAREAIHAVRRMVAREGFHPLFLPRLISHLRDRRLKADARDALVAFGADAIPILMHFIQDREESAYVRRALPRVVARIRDDSVPGVLVSALLAADDSFLRGQIVEALAGRRDELAGEAEKIEEAIRVEAGSYLARLADAVALAPTGSLRFQGPIVHRERQELSLLLQMIAERLEDHLKTLFGMLALIRPAEDVWAAWRSLVSGRGEERAHALEYLDNTLSGDLRRHVFAVIDDSQPEERLRRASRLFSVPMVAGVEAVRRLVEGGLQGDADARALATAGLYTLYTESMMDLYPLVGRMGQESSDPVICETAGWVGRQLARNSPGA